MSACKPSEGAHTPAPSTATHSASAEGPSALLLLNDSLRATLGAEYSDSWIENKQLHVAVTSPAAATLVTEAGAVAHLVTANATQLEAALQAVTAWRATLPQAQRAAIHTIMVNPTIGTIEVSVAPEHLDAVKTAAESAQPAGGIPLTFKESLGLATPY